MTRYRAFLQGPGGALLSLLAGCLLTLSFAPFAFWPAAPMAIVLILVVLENQSFNRAFLRGWLFGVGLFGTGASWIFVSIHEYGGAPALLAASLTAVFCLALALFPALSCWIYVRFFSTAKYRVMSFAAVWTLVEMLRSWVLTGFPWLLTGTSQVDGPLQGWFPVFGVHGITFLITLSSAAGLIYFRKRRFLAILALLPWLLGPLLDRLSWTTQDEKTFQIALVQGNIPQQVKWQRSALQQIIDVHIALSENYWGSDILVWPEAAIPTLRVRVEPLLAQLDSWAKSRNSTLITGIPTRTIDEQGNRKLYNSLITLGNGEGLYHKRQLVPFGEYVPLESWLRGLIAFFDLPMSNFSSGPSSQPLLTVGALKIASAICYEIVYPDLVRKDAKKSGLLLTVSNDTWFGGSIGPLQHLEMARARALENQRPLVRATNNGISALIDQRGKLLVTSTQFKREVIEGALAPTHGLTPFTRWGSWPVLFGCILIALCSLNRPRKAEL